eukprot:1300614-Prorocentrum_lima.AAC.1
MASIERFQEPQLPMTMEPAPAFPMRDHVARVRGGCGCVWVRGECRGCRCHYEYHSRIKGHCSFSPRPRRSGGYFPQWH